MKGVADDVQKAGELKELASAEFQGLIASLKKDGAQALAELLTHLHPRRGPYLAPQPYQSFISELARNSLVYGLLQVRSMFAALCQVNTIVYEVVY